MSFNLMTFIKEGDLVFDIGANHGTHTSKFLENKCRIVTVEPQPHCVTILKDKFKDNNDVTILQKAISNNIGNSKLCLCVEDGLSTMVPEKWKSGRFSSLRDNWDNFITVETTTLNDLIKEYGIPKFCKIDVEGHEYEVINTLNDIIPCLSFEYTVEFMEDSYKCLDHLYSIGYRNFNITSPHDFIYHEMVSIDEIKNHKFSDPLEWGDIYAFNF